MKKKKIALGIGTLALIAGLGLGSATLASTNNDAMQNFKGRMMGGKMANLSAEQKAQLETLRTQHEAAQTSIKAALEAGDYNAWTAAVGANSPLLQKINASNFPKLVEAYKLKAQASALQDQAHTIMTDLGIERQGGLGLGIGMGEGMGLHKGWDKK